MEWRHNGLLRPKISECKNTLENSRLDFFGSRRHPPHWLSTRGPNYQRGVLLIPAGESKGHFDGKTSRKVSKGISFLHDYAPSHRHLQPRRNLPTWASSILITHPILRIWPRRTTTCSLDWKNNWKVDIFPPMGWSLLPRRPGSTDNILIFWVIYKS